MAPVVLHLISSLNVGGTERLLVWSVQCTARDPERPYVVVLMNEGGEAGLIADIEATGVPFYRFNRPEGHMHSKYLFNLLTIIDRHGVGVIHAHNEGSRFWGMLARALRPGLKLVYTVHSAGADIAYTGIKRALFRRCVDAVVAISPFVEEEVARLKPRRLELIENGIRLDGFLALPGREPHDGPLRLVNVGRFIGFKGQHVLLEALRLCLDRGAEMTLTLAGVRSEAGYLERLQAQAAEGPLAGRVRFVIDRTDTENILAEADVFVLSSLEESFGLVLIEAMAAGLTVVATRAGGATALVSDGETGVTVPPSDPEALAAALMRLAGDAALRRRLAANGRAFSHRYDVVRTVEAHWRLYRDLAGAKA